MKLTWYYALPFYLALINVPFIDKTLNAASLGFCLGIGSAMMIQYYIWKGIDE